MSSHQQLNDAAEQVVLAFLAQLHQCLSHHLVSVVLYGSAARGELVPTSDIDLLEELYHRKTPACQVTFDEVREEIHAD